MIFDFYIHEDFSGVIILLCYYICYSVYYIHNSWFVWFFFHIAYVVITYINIDKVLQDLHCTMCMYVVIITGINVSNERESTEDRKAINLSQTLDLALVSSVSSLNY